MSENSETETKEIKETPLPDPKYAIKCANAAKAREARLKKIAAEKKERELLESGQSQIYAYSDGSSSEDEDEEAEEEEDQEEEEEELPLERPKLIRQTGISKKTKSLPEPVPEDELPVMPKKRGRPRGSAIKPTISVDQQIRDLREDLKVTRKQASQACDMIIRLNLAHKKIAERARKEAAKKKAGRGSKNIIIQTQATPAKTEATNTKKVKDNADKLLDMFK